jgi:DNA invertase Pin-like site-specific DNA recombinase
MPELLGSIQPTALIPAPIPAAQYLRMSTDHQKYSTQNQADAIAEYASRRGYAVVRTYEDGGRSGLLFKNRAALKELIAHVRSGQADYATILVYDVSRWGRFQDVDESAYYEFICREAGIQVLYCAEQFENDGSLASAILKTIKRAMAAEYSRELSNKVFIGQCRIAKLGFWRGAAAGFGLRRHLIDEHGRTRTQLEFGERKFLQTDRVILRPGPPHEIEIVRRVFKEFVTERKSATAIARELNAADIRTVRGNAWTPGRITDMLFNERYIGNIVYNRKSFKLKRQCVRNPPEMWVRCDNAFEPIVSPKIFAKAQELRLKRRRRCRRILPDQQALDELSALLKKEGRLSREIICRSRQVPCPTTLIKRFGSLSAAYDLVGFRLAASYRLSECRRRIAAIIETETQKLALHTKNLGLEVALRDVFQIVVNDNLIVSVSVAQATARGKKRWQLWWAKRGARTAPGDVSLIIKLDEANREVAQYYLLPIPAVDLARLLDQRLRVPNRIFMDEHRYRDIESVAGAIVRSACEAEGLGDGVPSDARSLSVQRFAVK